MGRGGRGTSAPRGGDATRPATRSTAVKFFLRNSPGIITLNFFAGAVRPELLSYRLFSCVVFVDRGSVNRQTVQLRAAPARRARRPFCGRALSCPGAEFPRHRGTSLGLGRGTRGQSWRARPAIRARDEVHDGRPAGSRGLRAPSRWRLRRSRCEPARARRASGHKLYRRLPPARVLSPLGEPPKVPRSARHVSSADAASRDDQLASSDVRVESAAREVIGIPLARADAADLTRPSPTFLPRDARLRPLPLHIDPLPSSDAIRQPDFEAESMSTSTSVQPPPSQLHEGHSLIASCPKCSSQLVIPPGVPTVACGSCGQAISPVVNGGYPGGAMYPGAGVPPPPQMPPPPHGPRHGHGGQMVKCPLCAALLQQPPGASLAICGGCHQVIAMPGGGSGGPAGGHPEPPPLIACPSCSMRLQPPPGAPLVACGGCRQVMQVPGVVV